MYLIKKVTSGLFSLLKPALMVLFRELSLLYAVEIKTRAEKELENFSKQLPVCGDHVVFQGLPFISDKRFLYLGNNIIFGANAYLSTVGGLYIGSNTHISSNVTICTQSHTYHGNCLPFDHTVSQAPVVIGRNVWIGMNVNITPGVNIGDGAIIGMGTLVTKDVPPGAIVGSPPYRVLNHRDIEHYRGLEAKQCYGGLSGAALSSETLKSFRREGNAMGDHICFVLSTGRSGSMTIAHLLSQHTNITAKHEPHRSLIRVSAELSNDVRSYDQVLKECRSIYNNSTTYPAGVYIESDHKLFNLVAVLDSLFPKCRFIWLTRNGIDTVASTYSRGWFSSDEENETNAHNNNNKGMWAYYRLNGFKCGSLPKKKWQEMSAFERNCWYWTYVNSKIELQLSSLSSERWMRVKLEDISFQVEKLQQFLGVEPQNLSISNENRAFQSIYGEEKWGKDEKLAFEYWCGDLMSKLYSDVKF